MRSKKVLLIDNGNVQGVLKMLVPAVDEIDLIEIPFETGKNWREVLLKEQPDVLLLDESIPTTELNLLIILVLDLPSLRVVVVNTRENSLRVVSKQKLKVDRAADFFNALY